MTNLTKISILAVLLSTLVACQTGQGGTTEPPRPAPTDTAVVEAPTATPVPPTDTAVPDTEVPPTATDVPTDEPTAAPPPDPIVIGDTNTADGCTPVVLNPASWSPLYAAYNTGSDPFFHIHTNEDDFFFNLELYTVYGSAWTGQTGTFEPDCNAAGICVYLVPDAVNAYWATDGEIEIKELSQTGGVIDLPIDLKLRDLTFEPVPGSGSEGCFYVEEVEVEIEN